MAKVNEQELRLSLAKNPAPYLEVSKELFTNMLDNIRDYAILRELITLKLSKLYNKLPPLVKDIKKPNFNKNTLKLFLHDCNDSNQHLMNLMNELNQKGYWNNV